MFHRNSKHLRLVDSAAGEGDPRGRDSSTVAQLVVDRRREVERRRDPETREGLNRAPSRLVIVGSRSAGIRKWSKRWLARVGLDVHFVDDGRSVLDAVAESRPQAVLVEAGLVAQSGSSFYEEVRALPEASDLPVVTICATDRDIARAIEAGSTDIARKPLNWQLISRRIDLLARMYGSLHELRQTRGQLAQAERSIDDAERRLRLHGSVDFLTELPNRPRFERLIEKALATSRADAQLAVLYLDLDRFKAINEMVGREEGDQILRLIAARLQACLRQNDLMARQTAGVGTAAVARLSGDEFTLLLTHVAGPRDVLQAAQGILRALADPFTVSHRDIYVSATLGVALSGGESDTGELLLQHAELAMCEAKRQGGGMVRFFEQSMEPFTRHSADLCDMLRAALDAGDLSLHYQPLVDTASGRVVAAEALLRWQHDELGSLAPGYFLPAAEGTDLMLALGEWVLRTACQQVVEWRDEGLPRIRMAVNIASCQLRRSDLAALVRRVLAETGLEPALLELELSENGVLRQDTGILQQLRELKQLGVRLSVDDFGTGQSAIGYLKRFPLDVLKIDRSYVAGVATSESDAGIAAAMVSMAHSLDLAVVAEGVEEEGQSDLLREWGCDELQGFLFSPAVRAEEFRQILEQGFQSGEAAAERTGNSTVIDPPIGDLSLGGKE